MTSINQAKRAGDFLPPVHLLKSLSQEPPLFTLSDGDTVALQRVAYLEDFWRNQHPEAYPAWKQGGIMERDTSNIARHNAVAGAIAQDLCLLLGLSPEATTRVTLAAELHDATKLRENQTLDETLRQKTRRGNGSIKTTLDTIKKQDMVWLMSLGYSKEVIQLAGANVPRKPEQAKPVKNQNQDTLSLEMAKNIVANMTLEEKIIWYVDAILLDENPVGIELRMYVGRGIGIREKTDRQNRNNALNTELEQYYGVPYYDLQESIGHILTLELSAQIAEINPEYSYIERTDQLPQILAQRIDEKAEAFAQEKQL